MRHMWHPLIEEEAPERRNAWSKSAGSDRRTQPWPPIGPGTDRGDGQMASTETMPSTARRRSQTSAGTASAMDSTIMADSPLGA